MDDEIDVAPVDAEVERRRRDDGAQAVRLHRLLDAPALADIERAVMQRDRQVVLVDAPELGEQQLRLAARIDEEQRGLVPLHQLVDFGDGIARRMPLPRHALAGIQHRDIGLGPARHRDQLGHGARRILRHQPAAQLVRIGDRRRQPDRLQAGHDGAQPCQPERQQMAALRGHQRMQLVEDDVAQILEEALRVRGRDQQRKLLRRGEQDVGRHELLALALVRRRVAGARLQRQRQAHLVDRLGEVALDIDGQRLQRRDVERVDAAPGFAGLALRPIGQIGQRRHEAGQRLAGAGRRDQQHRFSRLRLGQQLDLMRARRPAALREPSYELVRQDRGRRSQVGFGLELARHASEVARGAFRRQAKSGTKGDRLSSPSRGKVPDIQRTETAEGVLLR